MNPSPAPPPTAPRLLLVEDDPVSAAFLATAAAALPAEVIQAASRAEAEAACSTGTFDLFLFDANLPDGRGEDLLRALREAGIATVALAHTADLDPGQHARLRAAGFAEVLHKPLSVATLQAALRRALPAGIAAPPCWNDAAALSALGGQPAHVQALRAMFLAELPGQRLRIAEGITTGDLAAVRGELHRLVASCGFVGAAQLGDAVRGLQADPMDREALAALAGAIDALLASGPAAPAQAPAAG